MCFVNFAVIKKAAIRQMRDPRASGAVATAISICNLFLRAPRAPAAALTSSGFLFSIRVRRLAVLPAGCDIFVLETPRFA